MLILSILFYFVSGMGF